GTDTPTSGFHRQAISATATFDWYVRKVMAMRQPVVTIAHALILCTLILVAHPIEPGAAMSVAVRTLDGSGNNARHPDWGSASTQYLRVGRSPPPPPPPPPPP